MDTQKIIVDGNEVEIYTEISDDEIEDNRDLKGFNDDMEDTIELELVVKELKNGETNE